MGAHKAGAGRDIIDALDRIGQTIGYHSRRECPIPGSGDHPQAIDLCWFFDKVETSPLFAFEIESKDSAAAQGNANKLFAKPADQLQKPLFFFHIFLDGSRESTRKEDLLALYGRYNYAVYTLGDKPLEALLTDILGQHRRLSDRLNVYALGKLIDDNRKWKINLSNILDSLLVLGFERDQGTLLQELGMLLLSDIDVRPALLTELRRRMMDGKGNEYERYQTWLGHYYQEAFHWAMLACLEPSNAVVCEQAIKEWQRGDGIQSMMGPPLGRRYEYDNFVLCWSPAVWGLLAALFGNSPRFRRYVCEQIDIAVKEVENTGYSVYAPFSGLWLMLISIWSSELADFTARGREILEKFGGMPKQAWENPPSVLPLENGEFPGDVDSDFNDGEPIDLKQSDNDLRNRQPLSADEHQLRTLKCACEALIEDNGIFAIGERIASALPIQDMPKLTTPETPAAS